MQRCLLKAIGWSSAAVLGGLGVAVFLLVLTPAKDAVLPTRNKYGLVFDAGSTHTSLYIYRWPADKENGTGIVSQVEACTVSGPGISSYADNPAGAGASLKPCLDKAMTIVPAEQQRETPTYLGATAGMRLLREQNSTKAEQVFAEVAKAIGEYPVDFRGARILTGNEEGSFGWITVNYLLETLLKWSFSGEWIHPPVEDVVGALDLGGASAQITFLPGTTIDDNSTRALLRLYGTNYSIYTHSYLCYGQKQALKMLMASLHQGSRTPQQISHPCYPKGYQEKVTTADLYNSPCVRAPSTASPAQVLTVTGTGEPAACRTAIQKLFNFSCGASRTCGFNGVYQPPVRGQFFAFSGLYHNLHFLNLTGGQSLSLVNATIEQFCNSSWEEVQKEFPTMNRTQLRDACAATSYTLTLLLQGYKFNHTTWLNIHFVRQVANVDVGWTLGYMLNLTNMIPSETPPRVIGLQRTNWIAATVSLAIMLILIFCLLTAMCCQKNSFGYESL
ncbi:PREDICTED: ectonucleoside triphosphate diphosphohydrolase 8-like [Calidris pugnax]|uniref:ectonucleoside triphosphate diphosphohydrolase 8-like n=1 Tax=Calidris pugnax TaxID=198806 RepID=UPI00071D611F|nr:PREDICTED: ectonucleoside triphosphate diphosphohydrolase 8-like [Calidris pugnax]XP_014805273.1 PREDICTED: ectonucleoside triphosphate diphosphohydrolase 8-like [Calidris pugnax]XP_014805274.1 PREDICTED: ectonucleoside triphosphate diphosphohydrolase 8-like [Calidris pugnax]